MSLILCEWLNNEVKLSRNVVPGSFSEEFSTGYLLGELLHKYGLQDDFNQFSQSRVANAKLNNFSRLEPTLHLLGAQFNENVAQDIMTGQHGAATKLLYELYIALEKKRKAKLTEVAMETMRPAAAAKLKSIESVLYQERLKTLMPRQTDLQLQQISEHFKKKYKALEDKISHIHIAEQQRVQKQQEEQKSQEIEKRHIRRRRQNEIMARIQAAIIHIPKPPPSHTMKAIEAKKFSKKKREAEDMYKEIKIFEKSMAGNASSIHSQIAASDVQESLQTQKLQETALNTVQTATDLVNIYSDDEYIRKIQKRLEEDMFAREQQEKRRRKMLLDQLKAHEVEEKTYREEQLIYRLMRQCQQERRIAVQLMHVRHEKEVLRQNRIFREKQYEERRLEEFQEALDREAALAKQEKIDHEEQIIKEQERHKKIAVGRAQARYKKHYSICWEVIDQIIDLSTKVGEYRLLTNNKIPVKLMLDWKEFFLNGKPIYEQASIQPLPDEPNPEQLVELSKMNLLDEKDYGEYKVTAEIRSVEMEEEKERQQLQLKKDLKSSQSGKATGKDAKDAKKLSPRSPTKKKGSPSTTSMFEVSSVPISSEELKKQELALKIKQEYFSALKHEEVATKSRLELIKQKASAFIEELIVKAEETYKDMEKWLGSRFLAEMSSVEKLVEVARHHIESSSKIKYEIILEETDFFISSDVKVVSDASPSLHVPHIEASGNGTLSQLATLHKQFLQVAPKGCCEVEQDKASTSVISSASPNPSPIAVHTLTCDMT